MTAKEALKKCERIMGNSFDGLYPTNEINKIVQPIEQALTELEELKQEVIDRQETEDSLTKWVNELVDELDELKRYPTSEEVCEAIQRELEYGTVEYVEGNREFMFINHGEKANITDVYGDRYKVTGFYKSSTLTLIGRFYEGLGK